MALTTSDVERIRVELGYNALEVGAEPYVGVVAIFSQVIQVYLNSGASTTSATVVVAATTPTPVTITLASDTGFAAGNRVVVDVDDRQEVVTVQSLAAPAITALLSKAHTGTYPVSVEGGETIVRRILDKIRMVDDAQSDAMLSAAGVKKVDEIEFYDKSGGSITEVLSAQREYWRQELADALGVQYLRKLRRGNAGGCYELY
jgi:hypothetical protein